VRFRFGPAPCFHSAEWIGSNESKLSESQRGCVFHVLPSAEQIDKMKKPQAKQGLFSRVMVNWRLHNAIFLNSAVQPLIFFGFASPNVFSGVRQ